MFKAIRNLFPKSNEQIIAEYAEWEAEFDAKVEARRQANLNSGNAATVLSQSMMDVKYPRKR